MGGVLETRHHDGFLLEWGADNFITNVPWAVDLCRRIGFEDQLVETDDQHRGAFVVRKGKLRRIPQGFIIMAPSRVWPVVATPILSLWGKLRHGGGVLRAPTARRVRRESRGLRHPTIRARNLQPTRATADRRHLHRRSPQAESASYHAPVPGDGARSWQPDRAVMRQAVKQSKADRNSSGGRYSMFVAPATRDLQPDPGAGRSPADRHHSAQRRCPPPGTTSQWILAAGNGKRELTIPTV